MPGRSGWSSVSVNGVIVTEVIVSSPAVRRTSRHIAVIDWARWPSLSPSGRKVTASGRSGPCSPAR